MELTDWIVTEPVAATIKISAAPYPCSLFKITFLGTHLNIILPFGLLGCDNMLTIRHVSMLRRNFPPYLHGRKVTILPWKTEIAGSSESLVTRKRCHIPEVPSLWKRVHRAIIWTSSSNWKYTFRPSRLPVFHSVNNTWPAQITIFSSCSKRIRIIAGIGFYFGGGMMFCLAELRLLEGHRPPVDDR